MLAFWGREPLERRCRCLQRTWVIQLHATLAGVLLREPIAMVAGLVTPHYKTLQKQRENGGIERGGEYGEQ